MKRYHLLAVIVAAVATIALAAPTPSLAATTTTLTPPTITQVSNYGTTTGDPATLAVLDPTGAVDADVLLKTPGAKTYAADFAFSLPITNYRNMIQKIQIQANYLGRKASQQTWTWYLYNWRTKKWIKAGTNAAVTSASTWTLLTFNAPGKVPSDYVNKTSRLIKVRIKSNNATYDAKLDYLALVITSADAAPVPTVGGCEMFPENNIWNARVDKLPVAKNSAKYVEAIGKTRNLHPDFGADYGDGKIGIPFNLVDSTTPTSSVDFYYEGENDLVGYPIPDPYLREYGSDHHILMVEQDNCVLYELFDADDSGGNWTAGSGAMWNLGSNAMRTDGWTSADAAGLPILPGLARYDEIASGHINHALRFTSSKIRNAYIWPASHHAGCGATATNMSVPPMGQRFRLKASYNIPAGYSAETKVVLTALKEYGMILADCGSSWYISGESNELFDNGTLDDLKNVPGSAFEAVDVSSLRTANLNSYAVAP